MAAESENLLTLPGEVPAILVKWKVKIGSRVGPGMVLGLYQPEGTSITQKVKSVTAGSVTEMHVAEGQVVQPRTPLLRLGISVCSHPIVMKDMCAECGADLRHEQGKPGQRKETVAASVAMVHSIPELIVSEEQALELGSEDEQRLLNSRKLVLLVDLDQTVIHTTNDNIPANLKDVYHFQMQHGPSRTWYHTKIRPKTQEFLENISKLYELHICTFGTRVYAHTIAGFLDPAGKYFSHRILSRDECFNPQSKTANLRALFPRGDSMVCIIDDREDVWSFAPNLIHVKPYIFFAGTADINAPPGMEKKDGDAPKHRARIVRVPKRRNEQNSKSPEKIEDKTLSDKLAEDTSKMTCSELVEDQTSSNRLAEDNSKTTSSELVEDQTSSNKLAEDNSKTTSSESVEDQKSSGKLAEDNSKTSSELVDSKVNSSKRSEEIVEKTEIEEVTTDMEGIEVYASGQSDKANGLEKMDCEGTNTLSADDKVDMDSDTAHVKEQTGLDPTELLTSEKPVCQDVAVETCEGQDPASAEKTDTNNGTEKKNEHVTVDQEHAKEAPAMEIKEGSSDASADISQKLETEDVACTKTTSDTENESKADGDVGIQETKELEEDYEEMIEWDDWDDYLFYLEDVLKRIHTAYYECFDQMNKENRHMPDLKNIIPYVRKKVLKKANIVFSGVIPTNSLPEKSPEYKLARAMGANVQQDFISPKDAEKGSATTHVVAARHGTTKVHQALKHKQDKVHTVNVDWLWNCGHRWEWVDERLFPLTGSETMQNKRNSPDVRKMKTKKCEKRKVAETDFEAPPVYDSVTGKRIHKKAKSSNNVDLGEVRDSCAMDLQEGMHSRDVVELGLPQKRERRFSEDINPMYSFSKEDLENMDKEVEEIFDESDSSESDSESDLRKKVLRSKEQDSSSDDSLCGDYPRGWKLKKKRLGSPPQEEEEETEEGELKDEEFEGNPKPDNHHRLFKFSDQSSSDNSSDSFNDSVGSVDEEMAAALEKEFLS